MINSDTEMYQIEVHFNILELPDNHEMVKI